MAEPQHRRNVSQLSDNDDALLAYMTGANVDAESSDEEDGPAAKKAEQPQLQPGTHPTGAFDTLKGDGSDRGLNDTSTYMHITTSCLHRN